MAGLTLYVVSLTSFMAGVSFYMAGLITNMTGLTSNMTGQAMHERADVFPTSPHVASGAICDLFMLIMECVKDSCLMVMFALCVTGTDATHAEHIETIKSRQYVGLRPDNRFVPGLLGMGLVEGHCHSVAVYHLTVTFNQQFISFIYPSRHIFF